tara:strand:- start:436 stop:1545 length:1110 start_codon:yes stop_codon:yes gene_type:complete
MKISKVLVKNKSINYPIFIGAGSINLVRKKIKSYCPNAKKIAIVLDKNVPNKLKKKVRLQLKDYKLFIYEYSVTENLKNFIKVNYLVESLLKNNFNRNDVLVSVGGGIVGDFSGFAASIVKRGINLINIPTTLLAQVDSSIGGKTGVNSRSGKNLIGSFYQPKFVITELEFLKSLTKRNIVCGFAEILKHSLISDKNFFYWLDKNSKRILKELDFKIIKLAIIKSCKIKSDFVLKDEKEKNKRMILNFGHTFAHAIEATYGFSRKINHGEAVLIGMILATRLSVKKKLCSYKTQNEILNFYKENVLPYKLNKIFFRRNLNKIINYMINDKKNNDNRINLILLKKIGKTSVPGQYKLKTKEIKKFFINFS